MLNFHKLTKKDIPNQRINDQIFEVVYKPFAAAKGLKLRYTVDGKSILVTGPKRMSLVKIKDFIQQSIPWLEARVPSTIPSLKLTTGTTFPFFGDFLTIEHHQSRRPSIIRDGNIFHVMSPIESLEKQVLKWIQTQAKIYLEKLCDAHAAEMGVQYKSIRISDPKSRWGSCSSQGTLSFSWRLAFAPRAVSHYVVIHELAHLKEMNHSPAFWKIVSAYCPNYQESRDWLRREGKTLHLWPG